MCCLIFCCKEGIKGILSLKFFSDIQSNFSKQLFTFYSKHFSCLEKDHGSLKTAKFWSLWRLTEALPWTHCGPCNLLSSSVIFRFSSLANFHPCIFHLVCIWKLFNAFHYLNNYMFFFVNCILQFLCSHVHKADIEM